MGVSYLLIYLSLKKKTRAFDFSLNKPSSDFLRPLVQYDHLWGEGIDKHASVISLLKKKDKIPRF